MIMPAPEATKTSKVDNDVYPAVIVAARPVMDPANPAKLLFTDKGKSSVDFRFQLLEEFDDEGNPIVLYRSKMSVSYGQYAGKWSDYAQIIEAALGIPGGDKAQHNVDTDEFVGKHLRVQTANVASSDGSGKIYTNVTSYFAPKKARPVAPAPEPASVAPYVAPTALEKTGLTDEDLENLPF